MRITIRILAVVVLIMIPFGVVVADGDEPPVGGGESKIFTIPNPLKCGSIPDCISRIIQGLIVIAVPVTVVMVIVGAYQFMTSSGQPEKISTAKKTIIYAAVGFAVILLAQGLVLILTDLVGGQTGTNNNSNNTNCLEETLPFGACPDGGPYSCVNGEWICT